MIDPADYGIDNLPFGIVSDARGDRKRPAVAFEDKVVDLDALVSAKLLDAEPLELRGHLATVVRRVVDDVPQDRPRRQVG